MSCCTAVECDVLYKIISAAYDAQNMSVLAKITLMITRQPLPAYWIITAGSIPEHLCLGTTNGKFNSTATDTRTLYHLKISLAILLL